jgi:glycosyltransferase involved in cell wall biosynthesis
VSRANSVQRVLQVHTRYRQPGGEDLAVEAEKDLLEGAGVKVRQVIFDNADLRDSQSFASDLRLAASAIWSRTAERRVRVEIGASRPQVVHVHNTFPAASPSIYAAARAEGVAVLQTLHNYRFVCPAATTFRDGHACTDCVGRSAPWPAVVHACVRGSRPQSAVAAATLTVHRALGTFARGINGYLALTSFQRQVMIDGGLPAERIRVISNFLEPDPGIGEDRRTGVIFAGRLAEEKGIAVLLDAAKVVPGVARVIGAGPLAPKVQQAALAAEVDYLGAGTRAFVISELRRAIALTLPSVWFEGFPLVLLEAYATGTPVIASRLGSLAELVEDGVTGFLTDPESPGDLADRIRWAVGHEDQMRRLGRNARQRYETQFRGPTHLAGLMEAYAWVGDGGSAS